MSSEADSKSEFRPSDYLRQRRPERYSDSVTLETPQITRDLLEYHLDTLTNRNQEKEFEHFARRIAEKELCPNLLPQTGPTGGGDSKVDSETIPVAEEIALRWYQGSGSAKERWGFAFSAKKDWRQKARSDVKGIAETQRDYSLIYFITSQFVRDKIRAEVEAQLEREFQIPVRILDRQWITTAVLEHGREDLAINLLSIEGLQLSRHKRVGPRDAKREVELTELDTEIGDVDRYAGVSYQLAEDCLSAAILASELERDRYEVDGRFQAALRTAREVGDERQILRIIYRHAWASLFVYDDIPALSALYDEAAEIALKSRFADDISWLHNLWNVLFGSLGFDRAKMDHHKLLERGKALEKRLAELSEDDARPNNSLHARTILSLLHMSLSRLSTDSAVSIEKTCSELQQIFSESKGLGEYPFDSFKEIVFELGDYLGADEAYDRLFDTVVSIVEERTSEGEAGTALVNRGIQEFRRRRIYEAIRYFGRAQRKLVKDEYQSELLECLIAIAGAYEAAGLHWAARSSLLAALSICIRYFSSSGYMYRLALLAARELVWIEIKLGRIPNVLFSLIVTNFIVNHLELNEDDKETYWESLQHVDAVFSMLLLRLNIEQLQVLGKLPFLLDRLCLVCSEGTLFFAFGQIHKLREDVWFEKDYDDENIESFYNQLYEQPANDELQQSPELYTSETVALQSGVLGLTLTVEADSNQISVLIAESLLGALEAFLATSLSGGIMPHKQFARVAVRAIDKELEKNDYGIDLKFDDNKFDIVVLHDKEFSLESSDAILNFRNVTTEFIARLLPKVAFYDNKKGHLEQLVKIEDVFGRSTLFSDLLTLSENVYGNLEWLNIQTLLDDIEDEPYAVVRPTQWKPRVKTRSQQVELKRGEGEPPKNIADTEHLKHTQRKVLSLIDVSLWDKAKWRGTAFMIYPDGQFPPTIGLMFENESAARDIFKGWIERFGNTDKKEELRLSIVTGVDKDNPTHYRVRISTNIDAYERLGDGGHFVVMARIQTMMPKTTENLDMFLKTYNQYGVYALMPTVFKGVARQPKLIRDLFFFKSAITVKAAWEIGENDEDVMALQLDDKPLIPEGITDPPVRRALNRKRGDPGSTH